MREKLPISVHVLTFNSAATLERALRSAEQCAEIIVIDGGSRDATLEIARRYGATIIPQRPPEGQGTLLADFSTARNEGLRHAAQPWILSLDSDEVASPELIAELGRVTAVTEEPAVFLLPRRYVLPDGRTVDYASTYPNERLYFFHRNAVERWIKPVHERPLVKPGIEVRRLRGASLAPLGSPEDFRRKNLQYLRIEIERSRGRGWSHWLIHRVLHTLRSRLIALGKIIWIWLIPRKGVRLPLRYEFLRFWYGWKLVAVTCPLRSPRVH